MKFICVMIEIFQHWLTALAMNSFYENRCYKNSKKFWIMFWWEGGRGREGEDLPDFF